MPFFILTGARGGKPALWVGVLLCLCLCLSLAAPPALAAGEQASVVFDVSEPDEDGLFTMSMTIYNAEFNGFQFALGYDQTKIAPTDASGAETDKFAKFATFDAGNGFWLTSFGTAIDAEAGLIDFGGYVPADKRVDSDTPGLVNAGSEGLPVYTFHFKQIADGPCGLDFATADDAVYRANLPTGAVLDKYGYRLSASYAIALPESLGQAEAAVDPGQKPPSQLVEELGGRHYLESQADLMTPEQRLANVLILQIGRNVASVFGQLQPIYPNEPSVAPYIVAAQSRTYVPLRFIAESMGAQVDWQQESRTVVIVRQGVTITMPLGSSVYTVNGEQRQMDGAAELQFDRTMVPLRFVAEALGYSVEWDNAARLAIVAPAGSPWDLAGEAEQAATVDVLQLLSI